MRKRNDDPLDPACEHLRRSCPFNGITTRLVGVAAAFLSQRGSLDTDHQPAVVVVAGSGSRPSAVARWSCIPDACLQLVACLPVAD